MGHPIHDTRFGRRFQVVQTLGVRLPGFSRQDHTIGEPQSGQDVAEISGKTLSQKPFDIFEDKSTGTQLTDGSNRLGKHVPMIVLRLRETAERKGLARRASSNKVDARKRRKIKGSDIRLVNQSRIEIQTKAFTCPLIELNEGTVFKAGSFQSLRQPSASTEQLDRGHRRSPAK